MKSFKQVMEGLLEAWPGTPEYEKKFGKARGMGAGSRHEIEAKNGVIKATRKYDAGTGISDEPTTSAASASEPAEKRGRGRPAGKYGSYKKKVKESLEIIESLETDEEIAEFIQSLDEESFNELQTYLDEVTEEVELEEAKFDALKHIKNPSPAVKAAAKDVKRSSYADRAALMKAGGVKDDRGPRGVTKEDVEQIEELSKGTLASYTKKAVSGMGGVAVNAHMAGGEKPGSPEIKKYLTKANKRIAGVEKAVDKMAKEDVQVEATDTPGNGYKHQCALHVRHAKLGEGKCVFSEHAEPNAEGNIDWYTVDFGNGLVEKIMTENLEILVSESHDNHKKKDMEEALAHPNHKVLDKNKNNKLDKEDFAILRGEKKANESKINESMSVDSLAAFISKQAKGE